MPRMDDKEIRWMFNQNFEYYKKYEGAFSIVGLAYWQGRVSALADVLGKEVPLKGLGPLDITPRKAPEQGATSTVSIHEVLSSTRCTATSSLVNANGTSAEKVENVFDFKWGVFGTSEKVQIVHYIKRRPPTFGGEASYVALCNDWLSNPLRYSDEDIEKSGWKKCKICLKKLQKERKK